MRRIALPWRSIHCYKNNASKVFIPCTQHISTADVKWVRAYFEMAASQGNCGLEFAYQTANTIDDNTSTPVAVGGQKTSNGPLWGTLTDISSGTNAKALVRFGYYAWNTVSADVLQMCSSGGYVEYKGC